MKLPSLPRRLPTREEALPLAVWLYLGGVVAVTACIQFLGDEWWVATALLFAPRWVWGVPLLVLVPAAAVARKRRLLYALGAAAVLLVFPVMGLQIPSPFVLLAAKNHRDLRVMSYNVGGGEIDPRALAPLLDQIKPDVALFQECDALLDGARATLEQRGWHVDAEGGSCIASRFPIKAIDRRDPHDIWQLGGSGVIVRYELDAPAISGLNVQNMHLETVRDGLTAVMRKLPWRGRHALEANTVERDLESRLGKAWTERATGPLVLTGDFNIPYESRIYQRHWSSFTNAFSTCGLGFGDTKETSWHGIRIDHVLFGPGWECLDAFVGPHLGGDHRPMVADLRRIR